MATVKVINAIEKQRGVLRVAAYCRVSSDAADQLHSYAAQIERYTKLINETEGWVLVDIYADEGLTGTRLDKREDFHRMIRDCRKGKVDKILVKSIARFARNTRDCLASLRELTALGVTVKFEKEKHRHRRVILRIGDKHFRLPGAGGIGLHITEPALELSKAHEIR